MVLRRRKKDSREERERDGRDTKTDSPNGVPPKNPPSVPASSGVPNPGTLAGLKGTVRTLRPNSKQPYGIPWSNVSRFEPSFTNAGAEFGVDPVLMAAMAVVESDANHVWPDGPLKGRVIARDDGFGDGLSIGIMQVKPLIWQNLVPNADAYTPEGNIRLGTAIMADAIRKHHTWPEALRAVYFSSDDPNGTTQDAYVETVRSLSYEIRNNLGLMQKPPPGPPDPPSGKPPNPIRVIVGGTYPPITYGWLADAGLNYYSYAVGHGATRSTQHPGVDVSVPDETPLYTPCDGKVLCVGERGQNVWGNGCGFFADVDGGGIGNITILFDSGHRLTLGHCSSATVKPGERVKAGQMVGRSGSMNGPHVHVEVAVERNGTYWLVEPIAALKEAMGGKPVPAPKTYAERLPTPDATEFTGGMLIEVTADRVPVKQYASRDAPDVTEPLTRGEQFKAAYTMRPDGQSEDWYISLRNGRVPVEGTKRV